MSIVLDIIVLELAIYYSFLEVTHMTNVPRMIPARFISIYILGYTALFDRDYHNQFY